MSQDQNTKTRTFTILTWCVVGIGIIAAGAILFSKRDTANDDNGDEGNVATTSTHSRTTNGDTALDPRVPYRTSIESTTTGAIDTVAVVDQVAGDAVVLSQVTLSASGWVAVHEIAYDGALGPILGAARFDAGTWTGNVVLLRTTVPKMQYRAVVYHDDGDKEFDFKRDTIVMRDEEPVMTSFRTY